MSEQWRKVLRYPGYEVSDKGAVRGVDRVTQRVDGSTVRVRGRLKSASINPQNGYPQVSLCRRGVKKTHRVHVLVLEAFVGPRPSGTVCRHLNDDPTDNRLANLTWGTPSENGFDAVRNRRLPNSRKSKCPLGHDLAPPNLVSRAARGRWCLACSRARSYVRHHPELVGDLQAISDDYFRTIMKETAA